MVPERISVLIVYDQSRARKSLRAMLSTWLWAGEIREVSNGREALAVGADAFVGKGEAPDRLPSVLSAVMHKGDAS